jgi:MscS family membrane protein
MRGFFDATADNDFETAAEYLDLRNLPRGLDANDGPELARRLNIVFERELFWIDIDGLSARPDGLPGDGLPAYRDRLAQIEGPGGEFELLLQRVPRGDGEFIWKISNRTVADIPVLYEEFGYGRITEWVAETLPDVSFLGLALFNWVVILGTAVVAYPLLLLLTRGLSRVISKRESPLHDQVVRFFTRPVLWSVLVVLLHRVILDLGVGIEAQKIARAGTVLTIVVVWVLLSSINLGRSFYSHRMQTRGQKSADVLLRPVGNALKVLVILVAILVWLDNAGFNITTLLAGLGVGGIAIALALQKPMEDLFAAVSLYTQQQVKVGDYCVFGTVSGTVEEIGLRTSRIRTLDNTVVLVPNAKLVGEYITNFSPRWKYRYNPTIQLRYDASPDQIRFVLVEIGKLLYSHPRVLPDGPRVRFTEFGAHSLDLQINSFIDTTIFTDFLEVAEDLNLRIMDIVAESGTNFAFPTQTLSVERSSGADAEKRENVERQVERWRDSGELYLPGLPQEKIDELSGSIPYPPPGSQKEGEQSPT